MKQQKRVIVATSGPKESITCSHHVKQRKGINVATLDRKMSQNLTFCETTEKDLCCQTGTKSLNVTLCRKFDYCHGWTGQNMNCEEIDRKSLGGVGGRLYFFRTRNITVHMITHRHPRTRSCSVKLLV